MKPIYTSFLVILSGFHLSLAAQSSLDNPISKVNADIKSSIQTGESWIPAKTIEIMNNTSRPEFTVRHHHHTMISSTRVPEINSIFKSKNGGNVFQQTRNITFGISFTENLVDDISILFHLPLKKSSL